MKIINLIIVKSILMEMKVNELKKVKKEIKVVMFVIY